MGNRDGILEWIVATAMAMLVVIVFSQVVLRCLTYQPLAWTEEAARYIFIWLCLLGAAAAARRGQHFAVEFLVRLLPRHASAATNWPDARPRNHFLPLPYGCRR
jgi:TRAP-type C4-dicarboxylate transport system permease small subunit